MCFFIDAWKTLSFGYSDYVKPIREELTLSPDSKKKRIKNYLYTIYCNKTCTL